MGDNKYFESAEILFEYLSKSKSYIDIQSLDNDKKVKLLLFSGDVLVKMKRVLGRNRKDREYFFDDEIPKCLSLYYPRLKDFTYSSLTNLINILWKEGLILKDCEYIKAYIDSVTDLVYNYPDLDYPYKNMIIALQNHIEKNGLSIELNKGIIYNLMPNNFDEQIQINHNLVTLLGLNISPKSKINIGRYIDPYDKVGKFQFVFFAANFEYYLDLFKLLVRNYNKSLPTNKWISDALVLVKDIKKEYLCEYLISSFENVLEWLSMAHSVDDKIEFMIPNTYRWFYDKNTQLIRSACWLAGLVNDEKLNQTLYSLTLACFKKRSGMGALLPVIGNAGLFAFSLLPSSEGIKYLGLIKTKINNSVALKLIDKYIAELAQKSGKTKDQIEDENVPNFDMDSHREKEFTYRNITSKIQITSYNTVSLEWSVDQKSQKSVPAQMKSDYPTELKALQKQFKEIKDTLFAQIKRVESFYLADRRWNYADWNPLFHQHGLMSAISRPLIWEFIIDDKKIPLMYIDGVWKDENDHIVDFSGQNPSLSLWHPIHASADSVMRWRQILQKYKIAQPMKQAYREVYILTEAEANTRTYSNRFAAHILKNYQFGALCKLRNWKGFNQFHGGGTPELTIKNHKIKVQYYVDFAHYDNSGQYLTTDQVRFYKNNEQMDLVDVPKILFSESLRDVDMFVGVCSIGNDSAWRDGGNQFGQDYWQSYSFGDLSEVAKTRKDILTGILPKLKITKVSHIDGNFLVVKGKIRIYKIHLGSTNILMEPNNQYLCIVQDRSSSTSTKLFIPFEGDAGLSIIISKALLLADDDKISDSSIVSQIKMR